MSSSSQIDSPATADGDSGVGEIILFGVRVVVDSMRKSVSLNNLSQYEQPPRDAAAKAGSDAPPQPPAPGYASENDVAHNSGGSRERKRGVPWTEEEHKLFLMGLQKVGKGDWRGISRNFVKTRTPTQVASHAQKYFLRRNNQNRRRRRSSLFDITTDLVPAIPMEEEQVNNQYQHHQDIASESHNIPSEPCNPCSGGFSLVSACPMTVDNPMENLTLGHKSPENSIIASSSNLVRPFALHSVPHGTGMADLNLNLKSTFDASSLSLKLSLPIGPRESSLTASSSSSARHPAFQSMPSFNNGDKIISVA